MKILVGAFQRESNRFSAATSRNAVGLVSIGLFLLTAVGVTSLEAADKYLWTELIAFDNTDRKSVV